MGLPLRLLPVEKGLKIVAVFRLILQFSNPFSRANVMTIAAGNGRRQRMLPSMGAILMSTDKKGAIKLIVLLLVLHGGKDLRLATPHLPKLPPTYVRLRQ